MFKETVEHPFVK